MLLLVEEELRESFDYKSKSGSNTQQALAIFKPFRFKMDEIEGFRYRARDVLRSITTIAIKEARVKEIKNELLNSEKLKSYFEENPREEQVLRHDKELNVTRLDEHLRNVPDYIIPPSLRGMQFKSFTSSGSKSNGARHNRKRLTTAQLKFKVTYIHQSFDFLF
jgi:ATP-dependent RNA helicase DDX56/DBP9